MFTSLDVHVKIAMFVVLGFGSAYSIFQDKFTDSGTKELAQRGIWTTLFFVSLVCCYYLTKLVYNFQLKILLMQFQHCGSVLMLQLTLALFSVGILSTYSLLYQVSSVIRSTNMSWVWKMVLNSAVFVGVLQRFLSSKLHHRHYRLQSIISMVAPSTQSCYSSLYLSISAIFICVALPVAKRWAGRMKPSIKLTILKLLPWKVFYFVHHHLLFPLTENAISSLEIYKDSFYIVGVGFHIFHLLWLMILAVYVGYELSLPCKYEARQRGKREMAGIRRSYLLYPPKSQVVTGLSPGHYALRYKGFQSNGEDKEMKVRMRTNAMAHDQYRIAFSQLD